VGTLATVTGWGGGIALLAVIAVVVVLYFLPTIEAFDRDRTSGRPFKILVVNFFLGWTIAGWIAAWAMLLNPRQPAEPGQPVKSGSGHH
jgi:RsiW-degrading membrane proteinase PrsW (M82 family)